MSSVASHLPADPTPLPRVRLRRWLIVLSMIAASVVGLWLWWNHKANTLLQAQLDLIRARHEPIDLSAFAVPSVAAGNNRATDWNLAISRISSTYPVPSQSNLTYDDYPPFPPAWLAMADSAMTADAPVLVAARHARSLGAVDWGVKFTHPALFTLLTPLNGARSLADVLGDASLHAHFHGEDAEAIDRLLDELQLSDDVEHVGPDLVSHLVAIRIRAMAYSDLLIIAPDLQVNVATQNGHPVGRQVVVALIRRLADERQIEADTILALEGDRALVLDNYAWCSEAAPLMSPMFKLQCAASLQSARDALVAADAPNFGGPDSIPALIPDHQGFGPDDSWVSFFAAGNGILGFPKTGQFLHVACCDRADRAAAAISLAVHLYYLDHGAWPPNLQSLVPNYLPDVPRDPFAHGNRPMQYMVIRHAPPTGRDRPLIYFDSGIASVGQPTTEPSYQWCRSTYQWRDLSRWYLSPTATGN